MNGLVILSFLLLCLPSYSGGEEHYDVIASNNLFRPLGWVKPKRKPAFTLISTVIKDNDKYAILSDKRNNYKIVRVGDFLLGEKIIKSHEKSVFNSMSVRNHIALLSINIIYPRRWFI